MNLENPDTEFLSIEDQNAKVSFLLTHSADNGAKATYEIEGNGALIHSLIESLFKQKPEIREIFEDVINDLNDK